MGLNAETLRITPQLLGLIAELDEFKGAWRALAGLVAGGRLALHGGGRGSWYSRR